MEQQMEEKVQKLLEEFSRLGFPTERFEGEIRSNIENGLPNFTVYDTLQKGEKYMDMEVRVDYNDKMERHTVSSIAAALTDVKVPEAVLNNEDYKQVEFMLQFPPSVDMTETHAQELYNERASEHVQLLNDKIQHLHDTAPEAFNILMAKYNPVLPMEITAERSAAIDQTVANNTKMAVFSSYYKLKPEEMFNLLTVDNSYVHKQLYKKNAAEGEAPTFQAWVQPVLDKHLESGVTQMKLAKDYDQPDKLLKMNFVEVVDPAKFKVLDAELRKGAAVIVNNLNKSGEPQVLIKADPESGSFVLTSLQTGRILPHNDFRKDPMTIIQTAQGSAIVGKREAPEHFEQPQPTPIERENTLQKKRDHPHPEGTTGKSAWETTKEPEPVQQARASEGISNKAEPAEKVDKSKQNKQRVSNKPPRTVKTNNKAKGKHI